MTRLKAAAIHLSISTLIAIVVVATMLFVWYPGPFFTAMGGNELVLIMVAVDVVLGPLITLVVFNPSKARHLIRLDLTVIGVVQLAALAYGMYIVAEVRPGYMVFAVDRFDLVSVADLREAELAKVTRPEYKGIPWTRPRTVAAKTPSDPDEQFRIVQSALGGYDLATFPQYYVPYEDLAKDALARAKPIERLRKAQPDAARQIDEALKAVGKAEADVRYLPLKGRNKDYSVLLDAKTGATLGFAEVSPW
jgi:hypothetical protein